MKRISVLLVVAAVLLSGCQKSGIQSGEARISGIFKPAVSGYLIITAGAVLDSVKIKKNGEFTIDIPFTEAGKAMLFFDNRITDVSLEPGKEVKLNINSIVFPEKIEYGGELGPVNHYLTLARKLDQQTGIASSDLFTKEPDQFLGYLDSVKQLKTGLINEYKTRYKEIDPGFVSRTLSEIELSWANLHIQYPGRYEILKGTYPPINQEYYVDYLNKFNLNSSSNLTSSIYREFIQNYLDYRQSIYLIEHPKTGSLIFPESVARIRLIHEEFTDQSVIDLLLFTAMDDHLANFGTTRVESFLTDFRISCKNPDYLRTIEDIVTNLEKVGLGQPAINFSAFTPEGKKVNLSDYFGQLLYIGFWASWSDWSLLEIPYFEQLRRNFEGKPVKFIMVSLDFEKDRNRWAAIIKQNNFGSIQLIQDSKSTTLRDSYYLNDFPRYFLIDKEGKIISAYAPRPTENIEETLSRIIEGNF
jgi:alkyl hydroperoxide reductase subunit AhpC